MGGSPGITELMARLLREVEGGSAVRARFVGDGVSASGRGAELSGPRAAGLAREGAGLLSARVGERLRRGWAAERAGPRGERSEGGELGRPG